MVDETRPVRLWNVLGKAFPLLGAALAAGCLGADPADPAAVDGAAAGPGSVPPMTDAPQEVLNRTIALGPASSPPDSVLPLHGNWTRIGLRVEVALEHPCGVVIGDPDPAGPPAVRLVPPSGEAVELTLSAGATCIVGASAAGVQDRSAAFTAGSWTLQVAARGAGESLLVVVRTS